MDLREKKLNELPGFIEQKLRLKSYTDVIEILFKWYLSMNKLLRKTEENGIRR